MVFLCFSLITRTEQHGKLLYERFESFTTWFAVLLSVGPRVRLPSGTPASNAEIFIFDVAYIKGTKNSFTVWDKFEYWYVHRASIFPASGMDRRSFLCLKPWAITRDWRLSADKRIDFPRGLEYNKIVEIAQNSSRNNTYYELRYHTGDFFHA